MPLPRHKEAVVWTKMGEAEIVRSGKILEHVELMRVADGVTVESERKNKEESSLPPRFMTPQKCVNEVPFPDMGEIREEEAGFGGK